MAGKPIFTVFSGLYNSENVIHRLFESVKKQTFKDFEWIIIDDASSDNTVELVNKFLEENPEINANFIKHKTNKGIRYSRAEALNLSKGKYFVKWDHDDINKNNQLEEFNNQWQKHKGKNIGSIWCLCEDEDGNILGNKYPEDEYLADYFELYSSHIMASEGQTKERHNCIDVEVHKEVVAYAYEKGFIDQESFPDAVSIWASLSILGYKILFINKPLRKYFVEPNRESMSSISRRKGAVSAYNDRKNWINYYMKNLPARDFLIKQRVFLGHNMYGILRGMSLKEILNDIDRLDNRINSFFYFFIAKAVIKIKKI